MTPKATWVAMLVHPGNPVCRAALAHEAPAACRLRKHPATSAPEHTAIRRRQDTHAGLPQA